MKVCSLKGKTLLPEVRLKSAETKYPCAHHLFFIGEETDQIDEVICGMCGARFERSQDVIEDGLPVFIYINNLSQEEIPNLQKTISNNLLQIFHNLH